MVSKRLALQKLQHSRCQCFRHTVDFIDKQNALRHSTPFHALVDRCHDLTHRILGNGILLSTVLFMLDKGQSHRTLSGMMGDGIGHQTDLTFLRHLLHNLGLADSRRSDQKHRTLADGGNLVSPKLILCQIRGHSVFDFLFCPLNVHDSYSSFPM